MFFSRKKIKKTFEISLCLCLLAGVAHAEKIAGGKDETGKTPFDPFGVYDEAVREGCVSPDIQERPLTLFDLIEMAVCQNPDLKQSYLSAKIQAAAYGESLSEYMPSLTGTGDLDVSSSKQDGSDVHSDSSSLGAGISLEYLLYDFSGRSARARQARYLLDAARFSYNKDMQELVYQVIEAYYAYLTALDEEKSAEVSEKAYQTALEVSSRRFDLGLAKMLDKLQAQTAYAQAVIAVKEAQKNVEIKRGELLSYVRLPPYAPVVFEKTPFSLTDDEMPVFGTPESLIEYAFASRPDLKAALLEKKAAFENIRSVEAEGMPRISLSASASYADDLKRSTEDYRSSVGLKVTIPFFTGFSQTYRTQQAGYHHLKSVQALEALKDAVTQEVWRSYYEYQHAVVYLEEIRSLLESASESERVARRSYEVGQGDILTWLDTLATLAQARKDNASAYYQLIVKKNALLKSIGNMERI